MTVRTVNAPDTEPDSYSMPSENKHLLIVKNVEDDGSDIVFVRLEVFQGIEKGAGFSKRLDLNPNSKSFFATRLFLKACQLPYKGEGLQINPDMWFGCKFFADVNHVDGKIKDDGKPPKKFANIEDYDYEKTFSYQEEHPTKAWDE